MALVTQGAANKRELDRLRKERRRGVALLVLAVMSYLGTTAALTAEPDLSHGHADAIIEASGWLAARTFMVLSLLVFARTAKAPAPVLASIVAMGLFPLLFQVMALVAATTLLEHRLRQARGEPGILPSWSEQVRPDLAVLWHRARVAMDLEQAKTDDGPETAGGANDR